MTSYHIFYLKLRTKTWLQTILAQCMIVRYFSIFYIGRHNWPFLAVIFNSLKWTGKFGVLYRFILLCIFNLFVHFAFPFHLKNLIAFIIWKHLQHNFRIISQELKTLGPSTFITYLIILFCAFVFFDFISIRTDLLVANKLTCIR